MKWFNSFFGAMGTAGGVSWSAFGLVVTALSLGSGGIACIGVGFACSALFLSISIPVFFILYHRSKIHEALLQDRIQCALGNFLDNMRKFAGICSDNQQEAGPNRVLQISFLQFLKKKYGPVLKIPDLNNPQRQKIITGLIHEFIRFPGVRESLKPLSGFERFGNGFLGFMGTAGSVAGCSTGFLGVIALTTGFTSFPLIAILIMVAATGFGLLSAFGNVHAERDKHSKKQVCESFETFNQHYEKPEQDHVMQPPQETPVDKLEVQLFQSPCMQNDLNPARVSLSMFYSSGNDFVADEYSCSSTLASSGP